MVLAWIEIVGFGLQKHKIRVGIRVEDLGFGAFRVWGLCGSGFRVWGLSGLGFSAQFRAFRV